MHPDTWRETEVVLMTAIALRPERPARIKPITTVSSIRTA